MKKICYMLLALSLSACARIYNNEHIVRNQNLGNGEIEAEVCSLDGAWTKCANTGVSSSVKTIIAVSGKVLTETRFVFSTVDCQGNEDSANQFNAEISFAPNLSIPDGFSLDITPTTDVFSCGPNAAAFSVFKLAKDCESLQIGSPAPACSAVNRPNSLDPQPFNRL